MKNWLAIALEVSALTLLVSNSAFPCTSFMFMDGSKPYIANSLDWYYDWGMVIANPRGLLKHALVKPGQGTPAQWFSRYGSISFAPISREQIWSGMNEAGLVVETQFLDETQYPGASNTNPTISETQFLQYLLDTSANVSEALAQAKKVRIVPFFAPLHYFLCDSSGQCAELEYIGGELKIYAGASLPVPAHSNSTYADSIEALGKPVTNPDRDDSLNRFIRAAGFARGFKAGQDPFQYAFNGLEDLRQMGRGNPPVSWSKWHTVYSPADRRVLFQSLENPAIREIDLGSFDFNCAHPALMLDIEAGTAGNVTGAFSPYSPTANAALVEKNRKFMPDAKGRAFVAAYPESMQCSQTGY